MNPLGLAWRRYHNHIKYQWKTAGTVLDWTVVLYFVVPALLLGGKFYYDWWNKPLAVPDQIVELNVWYYLFMLPLFTARLRTWQEEADILFLRQLPSWWHTFIGFGLFEMFMHQAVILLIVELIALPWLTRGMGIPLGIIHCTVLLSWLLSCLHALIQNQIQVRLIGWKMRLMSWVSALLVILVFRWGIMPLTAGWAGTAFAAAVMTGLMVPLCRWRISVRYTFERDMDLELERKLQLTNLLLAQAVEKPPKRRRGKQPLLFSHSGYFMRLKSNGIQLGALAVKTLWRSGSHLRFCMTLIGAGVAAVTVSSVRATELLIIVLPAVSAILGYWLNGYWREVLRSDVWNMYIYDSTDLYQAAAHFVRVNSVIPAVLWSLAAAIWMPTWITALLMFVGCFAAVLVISTLVMVTRGWKAKETIEMG